MKTELRTGFTLVDLLVVLRGLPEDEIRQIEALNGGYDPDTFAMGIRQNAAVGWTIVESTTKEPLVAGGFVKVGVSTYRSFFLATKRAWDDFGGELTQHTKEVLDEIIKQNEIMRLETVCLADRTSARRWYEMVGLRFESELSCYGAGGEKAVIYVKTTEE